MKIMLISIFSFLSLSLFSQATIVPDLKIFDIYHTDKVDWMMEMEPEQIIELNIILNSFEIVSLDDSRVVNFPEMQIIEVDNADNLNIMKLNLYPKQDQEQWFNLINQNMVLRIMSMSEATSDYKAKTTF
jgi:hypothetical protein